MATTGFFPVNLVTSLFKAETTSGSLFTHSVDLFPPLKFISWCTGKWRGVHPKFKWIVQWFPDLCKHSHSVFLFSYHKRLWIYGSYILHIIAKIAFIHVSYHTLSSLLWHHPWIHGQDQPEERLAISVVHAYRLSEKLFEISEESFEVRGSAALNLLATPTTLNAYLQTFLDLKVALSCGKKISLMNCIWRLKIKSWSRDILQGKQINLPNGLLHQPKHCIVFRTAAPNRKEGGADSSI